MLVARTTQSSGSLSLLHNIRTTTFPKFLYFLSFALTLQKSRESQLLFGKGRVLEKVGARKGGYRGRCGCWWWPNVSRNLWRRSDSAFVPYVRFASRLYLYSPDPSLLQQPSFSTSSIFHDTLFDSSYNLVCTLLFPTKLIASWSSSLLPTRPAFAYQEEFYLSARWAGDRLLSPLFPQN